MCALLMLNAHAQSLKIIRVILSMIISLLERRKGGGGESPKTLKANVCKITNSLYFCCAELCAMCAVP